MRMYLHVWSQFTKVAAGQTMKRSSSAFHKMTPYFLFITMLLSKLLAAIWLTKFIWPPCFSSPSVSLSVSLPCSHSLPAPAGLADQEPGCRGNLSYLYHWLDHPWIVLPRHIQLPKMHIQQSLSTLFFSTVFVHKMQSNHFIICCLFLFLCDCVSLSQPGQGAQIMRGSWVWRNKPVCLV